MEAFRWVCCRVHEFGAKSSVHDLLFEALLLIRRSMLVKSYWICFVGVRKWPADILTHTIIHNHSKHWTLREPLRKRHVKFGVRNWTVYFYMISFNEGIYERIIESFRHTIERHHNRTFHSVCLSSSPYVCVYMYFPKYILHNFLAS